MTRLLLAIICGQLFIALLIAAPEDVQGCGGAYHAGERVDVADETALIVWDEAAKTEHFIRSASFVGSAYDFGFLVPTPSKPELKEVDGELYTQLANITKPKVEYRDEMHFPLGCGGLGAKKTAERQPAGAVMVLEQKRVGNLDYAILGFRKEKKQDLKDAAVELLAWLNRNQYAVRPDLEEWLLPYIRDNWVITAFKIAGQDAVDPSVAPKGTGNSERGRLGKNIGLKSSTVRMSFQTEKPFFPYREPDDQRDVQASQVPRLLRVFVAAKERMAGKLGTGGAHWYGKTVWANALKDEERLDILKRINLPSATISGSWWLTEFEDRSTPRPGTDEVYFEPSADRTPIARRPEIIGREPWWGGLICVGVPLIIICGFVLLVVFIVRLVRQGKAGA